MEEQAASKISSEALRQIEKQVEALISQQSSLTIHKRAIERQLASIAAHCSDIRTGCDPHPCAGYFGYPFSHALFRSNEQHERPAG